MNASMTPIGRPAAARRAITPPQAIGDGAVDRQDPLVKPQRQRLAQPGIENLAPATRRHALEILHRANQRVDLMLVDFAMPGMNGVETAQRAATIRPGLPILLATGYADAAGLSGEAGRGRILRKPFRQVDLGAKIADALAARLPSRATPTAAP
jgi:CheY-like chemotaxis protein